MKYIRKTAYDIISNEIGADFPVLVFPDPVQNVIKTLHKNAMFEPQVVGSSILFAVSTIIGLSRKIIIKEGTWEDSPRLWIAIVGKRGTMKTPATSYCLKPLSNDEKEYATKFELDLAEWLKTPKRDRNDEDRPKRRQRFSNDTTVEGLIDAMQYNWNGMGIYKDELNGFFEDMNRYTSGGNEAFYLSAFNGGTYVKNRKSYDAQTINNVYLSILGSIQPEVLKRVAINQTENGMIDRWLYAVSDDITPRTIDIEIPADVTNAYRMFMATISANCIKEEVLQWLPGARDEFFRSVNEMEDIMDNDCEPQLYTYLSKLKTYFARFIVVICTMNDTTFIGIDHVIKAKYLVAYFLNTAKHTFIGFDNNMTIEDIFKQENANTKTQKVLALHKHIPDMSVSKIAVYSGCQRTYASKIINTV